MFPWRRLSVHLLVKTLHVLCVFLCFFSDVVIFLWYFAISQPFVHYKLDFWQFACAVSHLICLGKLWRLDELSPSMNFSLALYGATFAQQLSPVQEWCSSCKFVVDFLLNHCLHYASGSQAIFFQNHSLFSLFSFLPDGRFMTPFSSTNFCLQPLSLTLHRTCWLHHLSFVAVSFLL